GAGRATVTAGSAFNVILGDSGRITRAPLDDHRFGALPLTLGTVETIDDGIGDADTILTGSGSNVVLGGAAGDRITLGDGTNLVFGDGGRIDWATDGDASDIDSAVSTSEGIGAADASLLGNGSHVVG